VINRVNPAQHQSQPNLPQSSVPNLPQQQVLQQIPPVPVLQHIPSSASTANANLLPAQPGALPVSSTPLLGAVGGVNLVPSRAEINHQPDVDLPRFTMNLPPLYNTGYGSQGRRFMDPRNVLYHDNNDLQWDNAYQIQLSTDVDFNIPTGSAARSNNPFVQHPPLASSDPKYPSLPAISHHPHAFPNQTTASPPILHGTLGPQTLMPGTTTTVSSLQTPVLAPSQVAPIVITPVTTTGTRPKTPVMSPPPPPPPNPPTDHIITRSVTGNSKPIQVQGFVQSVGKRLANSVKNKQEKDHNTRSISK
jgi:hypothetical protein